VIDFECALKNRDIEARLSTGKSRDNTDGPSADDHKFGLASQRLVPQKISISRTA
jgi:hypothetical protein